MHSRYNMVFFTWNTNHLAVLPRFKPPLPPSLPSGVKLWYSKYSGGTPLDGRERMKQQRWFYERGEGDAAPRPLTVRALMTVSPATLAPDDLVLDAMRMMRERGVRHIPIVKDDRLAGLVTETDVLRQVLHGKSMTGEERYHATLDVMLPLEAVMVREVDTLSPEAPVEQAVSLFLQRKIRCAPILAENGELVGIVTESDLMRLLQHMVD